MDSQFKKRVQAVQQSENTARQAPPQHLPLMLSPPRNLTSNSSNTSSAVGRSSGGALRTNTAAARAMRLKVPTATRPGIGRSLFGNSTGSLSAASAASSSASTSTSSSAVAARAAALIAPEVERTATPPPRRVTRSHLSAPTRSSTRKSAAAGAANPPVSSEPRNSSGTPKRPDTRNNFSLRNTIASTLASTSSHNHTTAPATRSNTNSDRNSHTDNTDNGSNNGNVNGSSVHIENKATSNSGDGNESESSEHDSDAENNAPPGFKPPPRSEFIIRRNMAAGGASSSTFDSDNPPSPSGMRSPTMRSPGLRSPSKKLVYDRFIPMRERDLSEWYDIHEAPSTPTRPRSRNQPMTPGQTHVTDHYRQAQNQAHDSVIANELMLTDPRNPHDSHSLNSPRRLFSYSSTTTHNTMHFDSPNRQIYAPTPVSQESRNILLSPKKAQRAISRVPFKVLDAPDLKDDFYLNLVDWSSKNVLGVGLGSSVYLWSAATGNVHQLCDVGSPDTVTSLSWTSSASYLAVGTDKGDIQIWDVSVQKRIRTMTGHTQRVGVLAWSDHTLTSGSRDRKIYHRDVRTQEMYQQTLISHSGEVCGLKWNSSGTQLASGGNDNRLIIWDKESTKPQFQFRTHQAAVKAIDWNPHQAGVLASGGGTADRHIRFWNTMTGTSIGAHDTGSQVCNLAWSKTTNELVSTHGYSQNQVLVWKYPSMHQIASLPGHTLRVLYLALSPDGQTIVTGAGDETLRFWNVFQKSKSERRDDDGLSSAITTIR
ncbi:substrate-specific activator of APC-dependent proteolysis [Mortierella sp. 14UC]|nr:substrate-specific activator of APC-dependent proteolysis [Mortierella sp. 14UC]